MPWAPAELQEAFRLLKHMNFRKHRGSSPLKFLSYNKLRSSKTKTLQAVPLRFLSYNKLKNSKSKTMHSARNAEEATSKNITEH